MLCKQHVHSVYVCFGFLFFFCMGRSCRDHGTEPWQSPSTTYVHEVLVVGFSSNFFVRSVKKKKIGNNNRAIAQAPLEQGLCQVR